MATPLWTILLVISATIIAAFGAIYFKLASKHLSFKLKFLLNKNLLLGIFFYSISTFFYLIALKFGELSILFPSISTVYIWISLLSQRMLGEKMNFLKWIGLVGIVLGVILLSLGS